MTMSAYRLRRWIWKLSRLGVQPDPSVSFNLTEKIMLSNRLTLMILISIFSFMIFYLVNGVLTLAALLFLGVCLMILCLYLNHKHFYQSSRVLVLLVSNVLLAFSDMAFGFQAGIEYYFIPSVLTTYLIFEMAEKPWLSSITFIPVLAWVLPRYFGWGSLNLIGPVSDDFVSMLKYINWIVSFILTTYQSHMFVRSVFHYQKRLNHANRLNALGEMAAGLAHEISSPLAVIVAKSTNLKEQIASGRVDSNRTIVEIEKIELMGFRISKIIQGLMAFSQNTDFEKPELVRVADLLQESKDLCEERLKIAKVALEIDIRDSLQCYCHPIQLTQVLVNLIHNSIDAIQDLPNPWVRLQLGTEGNFVVIRVIDSGGGIPPEDVSNIMNPFFTTKRAGKGTGLGLSISRKIVETIGGRLFLDTSAPNTTFVIQLPRVNR